jgi:thiol-disulfide isomerase/thioredoxin
MKRFRGCLKIFVWPKMAPFLPFFVTKMLIMRCITPLFAPRLGENVLIFGYNPKFKHPLTVWLLCATVLFQACGTAKKSSTSSSKRPSSQDNSGLYGPVPGMKRPNEETGTVPPSNKPQGSPADNEPEATPASGPKLSLDFIESDALMPVLEMAQKENRPVFVDFWATWCLPCRMMDDDVFSHPDTKNFMDANFLNIKVDVDKEYGARIAGLYEVAAYPTLLFLTPQGVVLTRKEGAAYHTELRQLGEEALGKMGLKVKN